MDSYVIGVDIGGTGTKYGIVDKDGNVLHSSSMPTNTHEQVHTFIDELYERLSELIEKVGGVGRIKGIGIGAPNGNIYTGTIEYAPNLPWKGVIPFAKMVQDKFKLPVKLTNDANAAAVGEMMYGAAKGMKDPAQLSMIDGLKAELIHVRTSIYKADAGRTFFLFLLTGVVLLVSLMKVNRYVWLAVIGGLIAVDEIMVDLRYLNTDPIEEYSEELAKYEDVSVGQIPYVPEKSDLFVLEAESNKFKGFEAEKNRAKAALEKEGVFADQPTEILDGMAGFTALQLNTNYRVFTFENPFNETVTSYFHKSIGGYHGAKVKRYQQLVDFYLQEEMQKANAVISSIKMAKLQNYARSMEIPQDKAKEIFDTISVAGGQMSDTCQILNMLNTKYVVLTRTDEPMLNPNANGNVWQIV